jgi:hypothetical protein
MLFAGWDCGTASVSKVQEEARLLSRQFMYRAGALPFGAYRRWRHVIGVM